MKWIQKLFVVLFVVLASSAVMAYDFTDAVDSNNDGVGIAPYPVTGEEKINAILDFDVEDPIYVWEKNDVEQNQYVGSVIPASELVDGDEWEVTVSYLEYVGGYVGYIEVELGSETVEVEESEETDDTNHVPKATNIHFTVTEGDLVSVGMTQDENYLTFSTHQLMTQIRESDVVYTYDADGDSLRVSYDSLLNPFGLWITGNDDAGVYTVVAIITDGIDSTEATITITVEDNGVKQNTEPLATDIHFTVTEGDLVDVDMIQQETYLAYFNSVRITRLIQSDVIYTYDVDNDVLKITYGQLLDSLGRWQTGNDDAGVYRVQALVSDGIALTTATITITVEDNGIVEDENTCPEVSANDITVEEGDLAVADYTAIDADGDALAVSFSEPYDSNGEWQTAVGDEGVYYTTISVSDDECTVSDEFMTTVTCLDANDNGVCDDEEVEDENTCPEVSASDITVEEGDLAVADYTAIDADGDALAVSFSEPYDSNGEWQTAVGDEGVYYTTISVSDDECTVSDEFMTTVTCLDANDNGVCDDEEVEDENTAPSIDDVTDVEVEESETIDVCATATDAEGDILTYTYGNIPGGSYDENGCWTWNTGYNDAGKYEDVEVCVSDGELSDCTSFDVKVNDVCDDENENGICDEDEYVPSNYEGDLLKVQSVTVLNAKDLSNGNDDEIKVYVEMQNDNSFDAENIKVTLIFEGEDYTYDFQDLDRSEVASAVYTVDVPEDLETGRYPLIVNINSDEIDYETAFNLNIQSESNLVIKVELSFWEKIVSFFRNLF